jgi:hypothetical protein
VTYRIHGLSPEPFAPLFALSDAALKARGARRVFADAADGFPCRVSLEDAAPGDELLLVNHVSLDAPTPFRAAHAIYVRRDAAPATFRGTLPAALARRTLGLRGFGADAMMRQALLAAPGEADAPIAALFADPAIDQIHAHTAAHGCFLARIVRD